MAQAHIGTLHIQHTQCFPTTPFVLSHNSVAFIFLEKKTPLV